jgi:Protein of unknown function (DUF3108)
VYFFVQVKSGRAPRRETIWKRLQTSEMSVRNVVARRPRCRSSYWTAIVLLGLCSSSLAADWQSTLTKQPPGNFPELRPLSASYRFGWAGLTAASGEVHFTAPSEDKFQLDATGQTIGFVRALWKLDANYRGVADSRTLGPIESQQTEKYRQKKLVTRLTFTNKGVTRARAESRDGSSTGTKTRQFNFTNLFDLHSAMLYLRSQPLTDRSVHRVVVYASTNAYLATVTVVGRDEISVRAGTYKAIKLDLQLSRIGKHLELEPHRKFRRATIWVSDDGDRILLRIEAQIFVGTVFAELQSVRFDGSR